MLDQTMNYLIENKIINENHVGGIPGLSPIDVIENIHERLKISKCTNTASILISLDQTGAFSMINHSILLQKINHIGFENSAINLIRSYLKDRQQLTYFNGSYSSLKPIGENSSFQGTIMATMWYVIYTLDQPAIIHMKCEHNYEDNSKCEKNISINFVDDNNSELTSTNWNRLKIDTEEFLENQNNYHDNNQLLLNEDKTVLMVNSKKKCYNNLTFKLKHKTIKHTKKFVLLGLVYNDKLNFYEHLNKGTNKKLSIITKIKLKRTLLRKIKYWLTKEEQIKYANAFIQGNLNYGISIWSKENNKIIQKIENLRVKVVKIIIGNKIDDIEGNTNKLNQINWKTIEENSEILENTNIHRIMTSKRPILKYNKLTEDRNEHQIKYNNIKTQLRSGERYNKIPFYVRNKSIKNFKISYKHYRGDLKIIPRFVKIKNNERYTIIWPGIT